ncbi:inovirus Gp2 family protein [Moritella viscosa]|uniref:YagK/YfjJ C-terminal domain-containing protein n=1 Tax=Moritella viscosa TaxID=80854 RepID=A0A1L0F9Y4_9GAMM|nr:inovirus Gp2 family protein [Moritella viscosa]SGZ19817.1 Putative uncharacterized protein [Moritella viscosa]SHO18176.1 Putative uncharacterized protein [Moritella viscosa]
MNNRLFTNTNLTLNTTSIFNDMLILNNHGPLVNEYLERCQNVLDLALFEYSRVYAFRFDLRYPEKYWATDTNVISKFTASLKAQIDADLNRKGKRGRSNLRYVWAKEQDTSTNPHYHLMIFLNKDIYFTKGNMNAVDGNLASMINQAWASALGLCTFELLGCVNFSNNGDYWINKNSVDLKKEYDACFQRLSYLAKSETKVYSGGCKSFGSSRK